jgi:hypothetical protein
LIPCRSKKALIPFRSGEAFVLGLFFLKGCTGHPVEEERHFFFKRRGIYVVGGEMP